MTNYCIYNTVNIQFTHFEFHSTSKSFFFKARACHVRCAESRDNFKHRRRFAFFKNRQLCHSNNHPKHKTQTIHPLLLMLITLSSVLASLKKFRDEAFQCPVCLEPCTDTLVNPECNHRFCGECIKESLRKCKHECPTCRAHTPIYRTCRGDPQFDHIVSKPK
jgi:hypothetical protein